MMRNEIKRTAKLRQKSPMARKPWPRKKPKPDTPAAANDNKRAPLKSKSRPAPTAAEKRHMTRVAEIGCVVCRNAGFGFSPAELHHPRSLAGGGQKASNLDVIPLCPLHHRLGGYGVAYHAGPAAWEINFGTELTLLAQTCRELGVELRWAA